MKQTNKPNTGNENAIDEEKGKLKKGKYGIREKINLKQTVMKKQILSIGMLAMALLFGVNQASAQGGVKWSAPTALSCASDALHPAPGVKYTYKAETTDVTGTGSWHFWATTDPNFIVTTAGVTSFNYSTALTVGANKLATASADYNIQIGIADPNENKDGAIELTWTSGLLNTIKNSATTSLFVVAYYVNGAGCTDNVKVWELDPKNYFTVDIIAINPSSPVSSKDQYGVTPATCVDEVESAKYVSGTGIVYDYGDNYIYYEFIAANFTDFWIPEFNVTGTNAAQSLSYEFTYATPDTWSVSTTWNTLVSGTTNITPSSAVKDATDKGVSVFVRVKVDHNNYENLNGQTLVMTLDGKLGDGTYDVVNATCTDPGAADGADKASTTITARPTITDSTMPTPNFVTGNSTN